MSSREIDELSGIETTGHDWDGIKELNNPLPRWWLWTMYATIVFSIGYVIYYPAFPLISEATSGVSGKTNRSELAVQLAAVQASRADLVTRVEQASIGEIAADEALLRFSIAGGGSLFKVNCVQCHGSGAQGAPGYPNLNDDDWLWGGDLEAIYTSIAHGVRYQQDDDTRISDMPAFGADELLENEQIGDVAEHVLKISGFEHDVAKAENGAALFEENCASCHGEEGKGGREFGAPNLADALFLYAGKRADLVAQMNAPKHGEMPAWKARLGDVAVKQLAIYVHNLGGGEKAVE